MNDYLDAIRQADQDVNPVLRHLDVQVTRLNREEAVLACTVRREHLQGAGGLAGGITALLLDEAMAHAALVRLAPGSRIVTVELSVRYFAPVKLGDTVAARAWVYREGSKVLTLEGELMRNTETVAAKATATFMRV